MTKRIPNIADAMRAILADPNFAQEQLGMLYGFPGGDPDSKTYFRGVQQLVTESVNWVVIDLRLVVGHRTVWDCPLEFYIADNTDPNAGGKWQIAIRPAIEAAADFSGIDRFICSNAENRLTANAIRKETRLPLIEGRLQISFDGTPGISAVQGITVVTRVIGPWLKYAPGAEALGYLGGDTS